MIFLLLGDQIQPNTKPMHTITTRMESWSDSSSCPYKIDIYDTYKSTEAAVRSFVSTLVSPCKHVMDGDAMHVLLSMHVAVHISNCPLDDHLNLLTVVRSRIDICSTSGIVIYRQLAPTDCRQLNGGTYVNFLWNSSILLVWQVSRSTTSGKSILISPI